MAAYEYPRPNLKASGFIQNQHTDTYPAIFPTAAALPAGRVVFISGASKGVGKASAISFAKAGASQIALGARSALDEVKQAVISAAQNAGHQPPQVLTITLDIQNRGSIEAAATEIDRAFGKLDIVVNNAGYLEKWLPIGETDPDDWWRTWDVNIRGLYEVTRLLLPLVLRSSEKTIVNISSRGALNLRDGASGYQGSKFALLRFTEFLCQDHAKDGLLAFNVHPGAVKTELASNMPEEMHKILVDAPELPADGLVFLTRERRTWLAGRYVDLKWDLPEFLSREKEIVDGNKLKMSLDI